jgi:methionine synthase II (cobalamin-independent)
MKRASPINVRKSLEMVELFKNAGIDFIPVPVATEEERKAMIEMAMSKLEDVDIE